MEQGIEFMSDGIFEDDASLIEVKHLFLPKFNFNNI